MHKPAMKSITALAAICTVALSSPAQATLTLTSDAITAGFSLTTFASDFGTSGCCSGPFGMAVTGNGNVLVSANNTRYVFSNTDGQTPGSALATTSSNSSTAGYARAGGLAYGWNNSQFVQFNDNGTVNHILTGINTSPYLGMWGAPNGHIIATTGSGLFDIDPLANAGLGTFRIITNAYYGDGVSVSPDGATAYLEYGGGILPINILTGVAGSLITGFNSPDGTGVIIGGAFNGNLIVNNNNCDVDMYDFGTGMVTLLAKGSSPFGTDRGDYTAIDTQGCLFLAEGDRVDRLCLAGAGIGNPIPETGNNVPEPGSLALVGIALLGVLARRRK